MTTEETEQLKDEIKESVECEFEYQEYIEKRKQNRINEKMNGVNSTSNNTEEQTETLNIPRGKARVNKITFNETCEKFEIHAIDFNGEEYIWNVNADIPENKSNEWVRLCEWKEIDPKSPADLQGQYIPINKLDNDSCVIDIPPIQKRLNPIKYKLHRFNKKLNFIYNKYETIQRLHTVIVFGTVSLLPLSLTYSLFYFTKYASGLEYSSELLNILSEFAFVIGSGLSFGCLFMSVIIYGTLLTEFVEYIYENSKKAVNNITEFLFPKSES